MRNLAVVVGGLLLVGGAVAVVVADQERASAVAEVKARIQQVEQELDASRGENLQLAEKLTALRSQIAEQDAKLADTTGFLK
jgi:septal ring factor EnvC (AmiA/AmiB activator)